jgi:hypothetical protein
MSNFIALSRVLSFLKICLLQQQSNLFLILILDLTELLFQLIIQRFKLEILIWQIWLRKLKFRCNFFSLLLAHLKLSLQ